MKKFWSVAFVCATVVCAQTTPSAPHKPLNTNKPVCATGAICFSGEVFAGKDFHKELNDELAFYLELEPNTLPFPVGEWTIEISPKQPDGDCKEIETIVTPPYRYEFASVVTPPYRYHNALMIDTSYATTAEDEVSGLPREFNFVTNCKNYSIESKRLEIVLWPYNWTEEEANKALSDLGTSPLGKGRLWITDSRISHANDTPDNKLGNIEWMRFTVEIRLPH
jgi:hypothetical protein